MNERQEKFVRDSVMFVIGAATFIHEVFIGAIERPYILTAAFALMGVPLLLRGTEIRRNGRNNNHKERKEGE